MALKFVSLLFGLALLRSCLSDTPPERVAFQRHDVNRDGCLEKAEFEKIFWDMDRSHDQKISVSELRNGFHTFHFHDYKDATLFFMEIDVNRDAFITVTDLDALYQLFDQFHNGCMSSTEYTAAWNSLFDQ